MRGGQIFSGNIGRLTRFLRKMVGLFQKSREFGGQVVKENLKLSIFSKLGLEKELDQQFMKKKKKEKEERGDHVKGWFSTER